MELILYIIVGIIWAIVTLIQKASKQNKNMNRKKTARNKPYTKKTNTTGRKNNDEEEIFRRLQKNIEDLKNITDEEAEEKVYTANYETSNNDREILELQEKYNSKIAQINTIKNDSNNDIFNTTQMEYNKIHVNNMLSSLDIKNAIIYNAILEPKRINYVRKQRV